MNAIGDVTNGILPGRYLGPDIAFHEGRDTPVNAADTIVKTGASEAEAGHIEAVPAVLRAKIEHLLEIQPGLFQKTTKGMVNQGPWENVVPAGTGV